MPKRGRAYLEAREKVNRDEEYPVDEAVQLVKDVSYANFEETVECHVLLGVDPRHADEIVRGAMVLPHGTGQEVIVLAFAQGDGARAAEEAGADFVGGEELAEKIEDGWLEFDVAVATPDMMSVVGPLGRILGPRGLMPNPKSGTVSVDIGSAIEEIKAGKVEYRTDREGNIHVAVGNITFTEEQLADNVKALVEELVRNRPSGASGRYVLGVTLASTMGPGVKVEPSDVLPTM